MCESIIIHITVCVSVQECVTYSVCEHFHPNKLPLWSRHVIMVKTQIYKPVGHTHTHKSPS